MASSNELVISTQDLEDNPAARLPVVLCLDTSASMARGQAINELQKGVELFYRAVYDDEIARYSVETAVVSFGGTVQELEQFSPSKRNAHFDLTASGNTPMAQATIRALEMLSERKEMYRLKGIDYFQPWLVLISDGRPTDHFYISKAVDQVGRAIREQRLSVFAIGVGSDVDMNSLARFTPRDRPPVPLKGLEFEEFFRWLSASVQIVSQSRPGEHVALPDMSGWSMITP